MRIEMRNYKLNKSFELKFPFYYSFEDMGKSIYEWNKKGYVAYAVNTAKEDKVADRCRV
jgi:hypothetical protein